MRAALATSATAAAAAAAGYRTVKNIVPLYRKYCQNNLKSSIVVGWGNNNTSGTMRTVTKIRGSSNISLTRRDCENDLQSIIVLLL